MKVVHSLHLVNSIIILSLLLSNFEMSSLNCSNDCEDELGLLLIFIPSVDDTLFLRCDWSVSDLVNILTFMFYHQRFDMLWCLIDVSR